MSIPFLALSSVEIAFGPVRIAVVATYVGWSVVVTGWAPADADVADRSILALVVAPTFDFCHLYVTAKPMVLQWDELLLATLRMFKFTLVQISDPVRAAHSCHLFSLASHVHALAFARCWVADSSKRTWSSRTFVFHKFTLKILFVQEMTILLKIIILSISECDEECWHSINALTTGSQAAIIWLLFS